MRGLVVVNPAATTTSDRTLDVITHALGADLKLDVARTGHRGHAAELAVQAREDALDVVVALGGDGTVNEVVNGILHRGPGPDVPALAIVPGGSTNVLARNLGVPSDSVEATGWLLEALRQGRRRSIGLGRADERWFTFTAGLGFDAEVVHSVEARRAGGRNAGVGLYTRTALAAYARGRARRIAMRLEQPDREPVDDLRLAMVSNCAPWTYLGPRGLVPSPHAGFDTALDVFALRAMHVLPTLRHTGQLVLGRPDGPHGNDVVHLHDVSAFTLRAAEPVAFQLDGDYLGVRQGVSFVAVADALTVVA